MSCWILRCAQVERLKLGLLLALSAIPASATTIAETQYVTASRLPQSAEHIAATLKTLEATALEHAPSATLDGALRSVPGFSLFRRSDSFTANPTAQGVSLRGLGPSGASRSLVLFDGIPLNDPFGGWIAWTKIPREGLGRVELVPGGGATAWGNAALGGVVQILNPLALPRGASATALLGDHGTRSLEFSLAHADAADQMRLRGRAFATNGFSLVAPERRGPIDVAAWSRHRWFNADWRHAFVAGKFSLAGAARAFEEKRGNGTPYQRNASRERFASLQARGTAAPTFGWTATAYAQDQSFASTFSAVNATRTAETPASDQFSVPATALGAAWTGTWSHADYTRTHFGADARWVRGETREHFTFLNGAFTRQRVAGGKQRVVGVFALHELAFTEKLRATLGARLDAWNELDGHRRETDRATSALLRDDRYADREGGAFSPSAGLVWHPGGGWRLRTNAQRAFRRPTLNELYRPFRQGANVTEANAALRTERVTSGEVGAEWRLSEKWPPGTIALAHGSPRTLLTLGATAFANDLRDAVANVTIARGPGTFPIVGAIPAGGVGRQRLNLDRTRVRGVELSARWQPTRVATITADYLYNDATVRRAFVAPALVGKRIAQVPRQSASLGASLEFAHGFTLTPRIRWIGRQFEDDENQLILGEAVVADLGIARRMGERVEIFLNIENLGNARIETGRSADGVVNIGTPRLALFGVRGSW